MEQPNKPLQLTALRAAAERQRRWMDMMIPGMTVEWPWNPNHKIKFYAAGFADENRWLFRITFSSKDQSLYLTLLSDQDFVTRTTSPESIPDRLHKQGHDFHLSLHESGIVNLTDSAGTVRVQDSVVEGQPVRHVASLQINSAANMPEASEDEVNKTRGGYTHVPIVGFSTAPIILSMLCSAAEAAWSPPGAGNTMMLHYKTRMKERAHCFHFVTWQDSAMPRGDGDLGMVYGGKGNAWFGL